MIMIPGQFWETEQTTSLGDSTHHVSTFCCLVSTGYCSWA